ncbi:MAG: transketolase [Desulfovibrionaceae bacterium]|nr:transketolase [Desulfovibrionaceae bacterium]
MVDFGLLRDKARWVFEQTLRIHAACPETRLASSLSCVEILVSLFYGRVLDFDPKRPLAPARDRFVISKGHGSICFYPILADLGFIAMDELKAPCSPASKLKAIPDTLIEGYETINGSLGHGLGVAAGMALGLERRAAAQKVFALIGDGELFEGSMWEAIMFCGHHRLENLCCVLDRNRLCMLDYCKNIIDLEPLGEKFTAFGWQAERVDGHSPEALVASFERFRAGGRRRPTVIIADTVKGRGVKRLEGDSLCHIRSLSPGEVDELLGADRDS